ncbi:SepM family pheromone-processing serine protease [Bacillaceae bacterium]
MKDKRWLAKGKRRTAWYYLLAAAAIFLFFFLPLPFFVMLPGSALELKPLVRVENGYGERGAFLLTTVRMAPANVGKYLYAQFSSYVDLVPKEQVLLKGETDEEYIHRQLEVMENSQETALFLAFRKAGYPVEETNQGALVMQTQKGMPADKVLRVGDLIVKVDGAPVRTAQEMIDRLAKKKAGDSVALTFKRSGEEKTVSLPLKRLELPDGQVRPAVGVLVQTKRKLKLPRQVNIEAEDIGGPSAGLMFTLEIYNQLVSQDLTKGYRIAGTGTIAEDGTVGPIGGIAQKVVAAERAGAEIFFAPAADVPHARSNYEEARETAERIGAGVKIVPVRTFDDALAYLRKLPPKTQPGEK